MQRRDHVPAGGGLSASDLPREQADAAELDEVADPGAGLGMGAEPERSVGLDPVGERLPREGEALPDHRPSSPFPPRSRNAMGETRPSLSPPRLTAALACASRGVASPASPPSWTTLRGRAGAAGSKRRVTVSPTRAGSTPWRRLLRLTVRSLATRRRASNGNRSSRSSRGSG